MTASFLANFPINLFVELMRVLSSSDLRSTSRNPSRKTSRHSRGVHGSALRGPRLPAMNNLWDSLEGSIFASGKGFGWEGALRRPPLCSDIILIIVLEFPPSWKERTSGPEINSGCKLLEVEMQQLVRKMCHSSFFSLRKFPSFNLEALRSSSVISSARGSPSSSS